MKFNTKAIKYIISIGLLAFILMQIDFAVLLHEFPHASLKYAGLATLAIMAQIMFLTLRWHEFLNAGLKKVSMRTSLLINLAGYLANTLFITSVGGIIAKSALAIRHGISIIHAVFATFIDRFMTLAALIILTAASLPVLSGVLDARMTTILALTVFFIFLTVGLALGILRAGVLKKYILSNRKRSMIIATMRHFTENPRLMIKTIFYSILAQICFIAAVFFLAHGMNYNGNTLQFIALIPVLALISSLPISFGGWGVREGAFVFGLGLIGFSIESAFLLSLQVGLVTLIAPFIVGMPFLINNDLKTFVARTLANSN